MLSLHPQPGRLRHANNLLPTKEGGMASRPAAVQIVSGDIADAAPWGNRLLIEKQGRIRLWDGIQENDIAPAGRGLQATSYQALTSNASREDRLYVADGINPLWYIARRSGVFGRYDIENKVKDANGKTYAVPTAQAVATWRGRLWAAFGTNRGQHCQFDDPDYWDPLWTVECQGDKPDRILAFKPHNKGLIAGLRHSTWAITGDSHYNWQRDKIAAYGVTGPDAIAGDDQLFFWLSSVALHQGGQPEPLSDDLRELFATPQYPAELAIDRRRRQLLVLIGGRLFAMHLDKPGRFGEIVGHQARGLIALDDYTGWYGADGAWVLGARDVPDRKLDGTQTGFTSLYDTWEDIPNPNGGGRAKLPRTVAVVLGSSRGNATYTVTASDEKGENSFSATASLTDRAPDLWSDKIAGLAGEQWPTAPVRREFAPQLAGTKFRHRLSADCHMEVQTFEPKYKFGDAKP